MSKEASLNNNWNVTIRNNTNNTNNNNNNNDYNKRHTGKRIGNRQSDQELNNTIGNKNKYSYKVYFF